MTAASSRAASETSAVPCFLKDFNMVFLMSWSISSPPAPCASVIFFAIISPRTLFYYDMRWRRFIYILCYHHQDYMLQWQDVVLTIINFGFMVTAIPAIQRNYQLKEAKSQSLSMYLSTAILLSVMAYVFSTLDMLLSCISTAGTGIMWFILTYQKVKYSK